METLDNTPEEQAVTEALAVLRPEPTNAMVDIETLGKKPFCPILSIGACTVDLGPGDLSPADAMRDVFYVAIDLQSCLDVGLRIDADTLKWWMQQDDAARASAFLDPEAVKLPEALDMFTNWLNSRPLKLWGNSARFDLGIIEAAYTACGKNTPWKFYDERCYRTLKTIPGAQAIELVRMGVHHNAVDDALSQAWHLRQIALALQLQL